LLIFVDDGSVVEHFDQSTLPFVLAKGDIAADFVGPLAYTFDNYKIEPVQLPSIIESYTTRSALPALAPLAADQFSIATFNVENLFDTVDPHPDDPPKPTSAEYESRLRKVADTLVALGAPTIIGLQEVENIGVLEAIAAQPQLVDFGYEAILIEGSDGRGIDVGYLVRGDQATVDNFDAFPAPEGLTTRHPLLLQVTVNVGATPQTVYILNNHFSSLSAGEEATEPRRAAQAAWNVEIMQRVLENDPDANFVVLGDLNSFVGTLPLNTLTDGGLVHVYDFFEDSADVPYTYIFEGATQTLDHILVSPGLFAQLAAVETLPINADYPLPLPEDATPRHASDHDPLIAVFTIE
jgi:predicted extracellular nuclease